MYVCFMDIDLIQTNNEKFITVFNFSNVRKNSSFDVVKFSRKDENEFPRQSLLSFSSPNIGLLLIILLLVIKILVNNHA